MHRLWLAISLLLTGSLSAQELAAPAGKLPIKRVVLYKHCSVVIRLLARSRVACALTDC